MSVKSIFYSFYHCVSYAVDLVMIRVDSWIVSDLNKSTIHEITRINTKQRRR